MTPQLSLSYAPDVFGGTRRQIESLAAQAEFQRFELEATYLTLTSNVVVAAVQEASLRGQIAATQDIIKNQAQQLNIVRQRFTLGAASQADVLTQEAQLAQTRTTLPPLQKQLAQTRNQLTALSGQLPSHETSETFSLDSMHLPQDLPISLPSQLVEQRPDVRAAEAQLHSASAEIGVATANQLPQFTISGTVGTAALGFSNMFAPGTGVWSIIGGVTQTLFDAGTLLHKKRAAVDAFDQTAAQYRSTVIKACQNVADALRALQSDADAIVAQSAAERSAFASLDLAQRQYQLGGIDYLTLLNAQRTWQQARISLVQAEANRYCGHRGIVPGARWRLVASQRCRAASRRQREAALTETDMIKRMVIMLIGVGIVLGGFFAFQNFKAHIISQVMASMANPPQTVSTTTAGLQDWQPQVRSRRQPARGERRRSVAGARGYRRSDQFQFRRRCACRRGAAAAAFRGRRGEVAGAAGDRGSRADHLRSRCEAVEGAGHQPGDRRQRHVQPEERACPGRAAEGDAWTRRCCARRSPVIWASARSTSASILILAPLS